MEELGLSHVTVRMTFTYQWDSMGVLRSDLLQQRKIYWNHKVHIVRKKVGKKKGMYIKSWGGKQRSKHNGRCLNVFK